MKALLVTVCAAFLALMAFVLSQGPSDASIVCYKTAPPTPTPTPAPTPDPDGIQLGDTVYSIADHPRFNEPDRLISLRNRSTSGKRLWDALVTQNNAVVAECATAAPWTNQIFALAVGYLAAPSRTAWRDCAVTMLSRVKDVVYVSNEPAHPNLYYNGAMWQEEPDYFSMDMVQLAYAYDFLHDALTEQQKSDYRDWMYSVGYQFNQWHTYYHRKVGGNCSGSAGEGYWHNLCITKWFGEYVHALSCVGEDARCNADVVANFDWYRTTHGAIKDDIDTWSVGCHPYGGSDYGRNRTYAQLVEMADLENMALGIDSWESWMDDCPKFWIHSTLPAFTRTGCVYTNNVCSYFDAEFYPGHNTWNGGRGARTPLISIQRNRSGDDSKRAQHWYETVHTPVTTPYSARGRINPSLTWGLGKEYLAEYVLRYDQDGTTLDYTGWPTTFVATGLGMMFSRDAWGDGDRFWMNTAAVEYVGGGDHQTSGCASFKVFKNGEYGVVENDRRYNAGLTDQTSDEGRWRNAVFAGTSTAGVFKGYGTLADCSILKHSHGDSYAYVHQDLAGGYRPATWAMTAVRRNVWHLKPLTLGEASSTLNYVVITDWFDPVDAAAAFAQIYVPKTSPTVSDPDVSFTLTNTKTMIRRIYGDAITATNVTDRSASGDCIQCGSGMASVQVSSASAGDHFLGYVVSMQATDGALPTTTAINGASNALKGALIDDAAVPRVILGPAGTGTVTGTFTFDAAPSAAAEYIIAGLTPGEKYDVAEDEGTYTMTESVGGAMTVDSMGVLRWTD